MTMSTNFRSSLLFALVVSLGLASCSTDNDASPNQQGLVGKWRLVDRQCYCPRGPLPEETVNFTATNFWVFKNNQPVSNGTYSAATVTACGLPTPAPGLRLADSVLGPRDVIIILHGDSLVLNYGGPCDAPVDTYVRMQ
jgi:hypothetical protein